MPKDHERRLRELRALLDRLTGILEEASDVREQIERSLSASRAHVEQMSERKRRPVTGRKGTS